MHFRRGTETGGTGVAGWAGGGAGGCNVGDDHGRHNVEPAYFVQGHGAEGWAVTLSVRSARCLGTSAIGQASFT